MNSNLQTQMHDLLSCRLARIPVRIKAAFQMAASPSLRMLFGYKNQYVLDFCSHEIRKKSVSLCVTCKGELLTKMFQTINQQ